MQKKCLRYASGLLALGLICLSGRNAHAQAKPTAVSNMTLVESSHTLANTPAPKQDGIEKSRRHPMNWAGIGVKVGVAAITPGKVKLLGEEIQTQGRMGLQVAVPLHFGGEGFSWLIEPYFMQSTIAHDLKNTAGNVVGSEDVSLRALGVYTGPTFNIHIANPVYLGFGFGLKGAYVMNNGFDYAADLYGRIPVHVTYYVSRQFALVAEVGFGYGASAFADKPRVAIDAVSRTVRNMKDDPQIGLGYTWDATFGIRLP